MSSHTRFFLCILYALAVVQIGLAFEFWGSFENGLFSRIVFQGIGVGLAIVELVILIVATEAAHRDEQQKSNALRAVFFVLIFVNWIADIGAIATHMDHDNKARLAQVEQFEAVQVNRKEAETRITQLRGELQSRNLDRPEAALHAELVTAEELLEQAQASGRPTTAREKRVGDLKSAVATVKEINKLEAVRASAQETTLKGRVAPDKVHPQFLALQEYLSWVGVEAKTRDIQLFMGLLMATVLRAVLAVGFWAATAQDGSATKNKGGFSIGGFFNKLFGGGRDRNDDDDDDDGGSQKPKSKPMRKEAPAAQQPEIQAPTRRGPWTPRVIEGEDLHVSPAQKRKPNSILEPQPTSALSGRPKSHSDACPVCDQPVAGSVSDDAYWAELDKFDSDFDGPPYAH